MTDTQKQIEDIYAAKLKKQESQLKQDYDAALSDLDTQKQAHAEQTQANIDQTRLDSQRAAVNNAEYYAAAGLTSGAKAQADLAQANQLQANVTALRAQQQAADAEAERQRGLLSQQYMSAIRQAQADNDLAKAEALYKQAKEDQDNLTSLLGADILAAQNGTQIDMESLKKLPYYDKLTPEKLVKLVAAGYVREYEKDGKLAYEFRALPPVGFWD